jgi:hypothetical protein
MMVLAAAGNWRLLFVFLSIYIYLIFLLLLLLPRDACTCTRRVYRIHAFLATVMRLVPKARSDIFRVIASMFPYFTKRGDDIKWYYSQCFKMLDYHPAIESQVLELVIDKSLEIDVNIKIKDGGEVIIDDEKEEDDAEDMFALDMEAEKKIEKEKRMSGVMDVNELSDKVGFCYFKKKAFE